VSPGDEAMAAQDAGLTVVAIRSGPSSTAVCRDDPPLRLQIPVYAKPGASRLPDPDGTSARSRLSDGGSSTDCHSRFRDAIIRPATSLQEQSGVPGALLMSAMTEA
jgi:hypothetical protein